MSYYLGKVGRAGARLVHSCRELYNDVNAAYLTGAVDVLVVRQRDGSLKSTPFHARFGKLGVLRTGDYKEVEVTLNGKTVDLPMIIDESGKIFFAQPRPPQTSVSMSEDDVEPSSSSNQMTGSVAMGNEGTRGSETAGNDEPKIGDGRGGREGERENSDDVIIDMETPSATADESSFEEITTSPESHVIDHGDHVTNGDDHVTNREDHVTNRGDHVTNRGDHVTNHGDHVTNQGDHVTNCGDHVTGEEELTPVLEGTLILASRRGSDTELEREKGEEPVGGVNLSSSAHWPLSQKKSLPIPITVLCPPTGGYCSLPADLECMSDSALDEERYLQSSSPAAKATALSDTEVEVKDRLSSKLWEWSGDSSRHLSNTEKERRKRAANTISLEDNLQPAAPGSQAGFWGALTGMLRLRHQRRLSLEEGIYLDAIDDASMDPQKLSQFFPDHVSSPDGGGVQPEGTGGGASSGLGSSPIPISPIHTLNPHQYRHGDNLDKLVSTLEGVTLSLCGGLGQGNISEEAFKNSLISFADFYSNPEVLLDPKLVVRIRGKYYPWQLAAPMIMCAVVFLQPLPDAALSKLQKRYMPKKRQSFWSFWGRRNTSDEEVTVPTDSARKSARSEGATPLSGTPKKQDEKMREGESEGGREGEREGGRERERGREREEHILSSDDEGPVAMVSRPRQRSLRKRRLCVLTNTLTSQQLSSLDLRPGANEVVFSITTKFQGTTRAVCTVYLWDYHDKVVISDIDGTITRSDVVGQVLPLVGMDWTQNGVVELFNAVARNGYRVIYLSARAIGQAGYTKDFLRKITRGRTALPDGPLFLTPSSLVTAFKKEVIEKRPYEFKIECLQQVRALFPSNYCPLHAGFGNRHSDVRSYAQVGIPRSRIFTVNHKGHLKYELSSTFQTSYLHLMEFVDAQFPPIDRPLKSPSPPSHPPSPHLTREEYTTFSFWRTDPPTQMTFDLNNT